MKWRNLLMPKEIVADEAAATPTFARFKIEPLERGFGNTIGNALRRTLLSSIQGAAVTAVKIQTVLHEFGTVKGVKEDVTDIVLNLKQLIIRMNGDEPKFLHIDVTKKGEVPFGKTCLSSYTFSLFFFIRRMFFSAGLRGTTPPRFARLPS